ncbi:MAG: SEC-C metal-binding domain-containing protein [Methylomicrobium sp.]
MEYSEQTRQLLGLGEAQLPLSDYLSLGFTTEHVGELIRMATDPELLNADEGSSEFWATVHAWYALGQLKATEAIASLLDLHDQYPYDKLFSEEFPKVVALMGVSAIPALKDYLWDTSKTEMTRSTALPCLEEIGLTHRQECLTVFTEFLLQADESCKSLAGLVICSFIKLRATEHIEIIRSTFNRGCVDISIPGDLEDVEIALGLRDIRTTPRPNYNNFPPEVLEQLQTVREMMGLDESNLDDYMESETIRLPRKIGRNDPCPCGSGKKYKKCCLH